MSKDILANFVTEILNGNNKYSNAIVYDDKFYSKAITQKIVFKNNHREQYNRLLAFCIQNNLTIIKTHPGTLETIVRIELKGEC